LALSCVKQGESGVARKRAAPLHSYGTSAERCSKNTHASFAHSGASISVEEDVPVRRERRPSLTVIVRQLRRASVTISGYQIDPSTGTVNIITDGKLPLVATGDNDDDAPDRSEWH
jgi:hypothetical protein